MLADKFKIPALLKTREEGGMHQARNVKKRVERDFKVTATRFGDKFLKERKGKRL